MRVLMIGLALAGTAACTHSDPPVRAAPAPAPTQAAPVGVPYDAAKAPLWFVQRGALPTCGYVTVTNAKPAVPTDVLRCLAERGGELGVGRPTVEGDVVVTYYRRVAGSKETVVVTDSTRDAWSSRAWTRQVCTELSPTDLQGASCRPATVI